MWVHVADATRWVGLGTPLEAEAESRGASGYHPRGVLPMFPLPVAAGLMSLTPGEPKCAVSVTAVIDESGATEEYWVGTSTIRVTRAATEGEVIKMLAEEPGRHESLELLVEAARRRRELRLKRGAVDVRTPEATARVFDVGEGEGFVEGDRRRRSPKRGEPVRAIRDRGSEGGGCRPGRPTDPRRPQRRQGPRRGGDDPVRRAHRPVRVRERRAAALPRAARAEGHIAKDVGRDSGRFVPGGAQAVQHARREPGADSPQARGSRDRRVRPVLVADSSVHRPAGALPGEGFSARRDASVERRRLVARSSTPTAIGPGRCAPRAGSPISSGRSSGIGAAGWTRTTSGPW